MNDRPPLVKTLEDYKSRYQHLIPTGTPDKQIIQKIEGGQWVNLEERTGILADWNARPEQVAAKKRKERLELVSMITIVGILSAVAILWFLSGMPINFPK